MKLDQIERKLTGGEKRSKEAHYKKLKKHKGDFIDRYGKEDGEAIMHAIATNRAKGESIEEKKKNCGCGKDPCETYGKQQESKDEYKPHMMYKGSKKDYRAKYPTKKKHHDSLMSRGYNHDDPETKKKEEDIAPKGPEVTIGDYTTEHFFMCGSAIETAEKHADKPGMERLIRLQDMVYKLEKAVIDSGKEAIPEVKGFAQTLHSAVMDQAKKVGIEDEVADYQKMHLDSIVKGDPKPGFGRVDEGYKKKKKKKKKTEGKGFNKMVITPHQNLPSTNTPFGGTTMIGKGFKDLQKAQAKTQTAVDQRQGAGMSRIGVFKNIDRTDFSPNVFPTRTKPKKPRPMTQSKASKGKALEAWLEENKMYGVMTEAEFDEAAGKKDACYYKVKSRYKVWPSAYASGALVQCRKKGAKNWGNKSKKK